MSNPSLPAGIGVVRYEGQPVQTFQTVKSDNNAPFVTSPDDKVVMTINLVSLRYGTVLSRFV